VKLIKLYIGKLQLMFTSRYQYKNPEQRANKRRHKPKHQDKGGSVESKSERTSDKTNWKGKC